jgi:hypothetical protein
MIPPVRFADTEKQQRKPENKRRQTFNSWEKLRYSCCKKFTIPIELTAPLGHGPSGIGFQPVFSSLLERCLSGDSRQNG